MWKLPEFVTEEDLTDKPLILLLLLASVLQTSITYSQESRPRLANQDVVTPLAHGLPEPVVLQAFEVTENEFDVSTDGLRCLRNAGVGDRLIEAMVHHTSENPLSVIDFG